MDRNPVNASYLSSSKVNLSGDAGNNERMQKLAEKLGKVSSVIENEKNTKFDQYDQKIVSISNNIEDSKENNNRKFTDVKEQV